MIARPGQTGWQTILADLALILFMICASALSVAEGPAPAAVKAQAAPLRAPPPPAPHPVTPSQQAEPVGVWRDGPGAPPLAQWLADQAADPRLRLSIVVRYGARSANPQSAREAALEQAARLARTAGPRAGSARVVVEPGAQPGASVALGYDEESL